MDSENDNTHDNHTPHDDADGGIRPLGYWLRAVETLLHREFATAFGDEGVSRREWMLLGAVAGDVKAPGFGVGGKGLRRLEQRGWVEETGDGTWILTDEGRAAKERLGAMVDGIRSRVAGAVSPEDFATTLASLEAIARELGWEETENERMPRPDFGRGFGRGSGWGFGRGFGSWSSGHDFRGGSDPSGHQGFRPEFGPRGGPAAMPDDAAWHAPHHGHGDHAPGDHGHADDGHGHGHGQCRHNQGHGYGNAHGDHRPHGRSRDTEHAYDRGFDAGFRRGQAAS